MNNSYRYSLYVIGILFAFLGTLFTFSPELLNHSPVGFEKRGIVHHIWHYMILIGGFTLTIGLAWRDRLFERIGLILCGLPVALNTTALITAGGEELSGKINEGVSGMDIVVRLIVLCVIIVRFIELRNEDR